MKRNSVGPIFIGIASILGFSALEFFIDILSHASLGGSAKGDLIFKILKTLILVILGWVVMRLFQESLWKPFAQKHGRPAPQILITLLNLAIIFTTLTIITVFVFNRSVFSLAAVGGLMSAGVAFALHGPINDVFSSIVMEIEGTYKIGDWLKLHKGMEGQVVKINWRTTTLVSHDHITYVVSNGSLVKEGFENISKPDASYIDTVEVTLDHNVPLDRAERLLRSAVLSVPLIHNKRCDAMALKSWEGGIVYAVRYGVPDHSQWRLIRHQVLEAITRNLRLYNMSISRKLGDYGDYRAIEDGLPLKEAIPLDTVEIFKRVDIFQILSDEDLKTLATASHKHLFAANDIIVRQGDNGDSMFVVGEGAVEVILEVKDKDDDKAQEQILALLTFGQFFGDIALLLGHTRTATVKAKTNVVIYEVTKAAMAPILKKNPSLVKELSEIIAQRKTSLQEALEVVEEIAEEEQKNKLKRIMKGIKDFFGV